MDDLPVPPPMQVVRKGWCGDRVLDHVEAERYHLLEAAKLAGLWFSASRQAQAHHIEEARRNREAQRLVIPMPAGVKPPGSAVFREGMHKKGGMNPDPDPDYRPPKPHSFRRRATD